MIKQDFDKLIVELRAAGYLGYYNAGNEPSQEFYFVVTSGGNKGEKLKMSRHYNFYNTELYLIGVDEERATARACRYHYSTINRIDHEGNEIINDGGPTDMFGRMIEVGDWIACCGGGGTGSSHQQVGKVMNISKNGLPSVKWLIRDGKKITTPKTSSITKAEKSIKLPLDGSYMVLWVLENYGRGVDEV